MRGKRSTRAQLLSGSGPLARVSPLLAFVVVAAVFALGIVIGGGTGAALLGLLAAGVAVLLATTWPVLQPAQRAGRALVLLVLVAVAMSVLVAK